MSSALIMVCTCAVGGHWRQLNVQRENISE
jgi:hypothetical protein